MTRSGLHESPVAPKLRRVLILADESAHWKVAGRRQLDRLLLTLSEFARDHQPEAPVRVSVIWSAGVEGTSEASQYPGIEFADWKEVKKEDGNEILLNTRVFLYRDSVAKVVAGLAAGGQRDEREFLSPQRFRDAEADLKAKLQEKAEVGWDYLTSASEIPACERRFLKHNGKSQDGLASRYVNRPISRLVSRLLLKTSITPSAWSILIFALPLCASIAFLRGTSASFILGAAIFQLYSILDGCDGEIARAKFLQSEFGRRLDSFCDLIGNVLLALTLGIGLARFAERAGAPAPWFYLVEGILAGVLILLSEGIVFVRRTRTEHPIGMLTKWNGALYHRHHEFLERSGLLLLGERAAWWIVQLTKRDMAMLAFLLLALVGWPQCILHLLSGVAGISSALAGNAFLRQPAPVPQEAS